MRSLAHAHYMGPTYILSHDEMEGEYLSSQSSAILKIFRLLDWFVMAGPKRVITS